jgi:hypothetical protein
MSDHACQKYNHLRDNSDPILKTLFDLNVTNESKRKFFTTFSKMK